MTMITTNILQRTFRIMYDNRTGTCFTIDVDGRQYLITAQHVASSIIGSGIVKIFQEGIWKNLQVELVGQGENGVDITVLAPGLRLSPSHPLNTSMAGVIVSQDMYFLGFPYGLMNDGGQLNADFPLPLVKKGILSAMQFGNVRKLLLDGHNNPGFSGGPVVCHRVDDPKDQLTVVGVVSGYLQSSEPVYDANRQAAYSFYSNTGIVEAHGIGHALDLIHANPVGIIIQSE